MCARECEWADQPRKGRRRASESGKGDSYEEGEREEGNEGKRRMILSVFHVCPPRPATPLPNCRLTVSTDQLQLSLQPFNPIQSNHDRTATKRVADEGDRVSGLLVRALRSLRDLCVVAGWLPFFLIGCGAAVPLHFPSSCSYRRADG